MSNRYSIFAQVPGGEVPGGQGPMPNEQPPPMGPQNPPIQPAQPMQAPPQMQQGQQMQPLSGPEDDQDEMKAYRQAKKRQMMMTVAIVALVVVIAAGAGYYFVLAPKGVGPTTTTTSVSTTVAAQVFEISSCSALTSPGTYYLSSSISTSISSGACIDITSPNVTIIGNGNKITGSGPYVSNPPYTYGILFGNVSNVNVKGVSVAKFSYDVYFNNSNNDTIVNGSIGNGTISGIYFASSSHDSVLNDSITGAESDEGAINLASGGSEQVLGDVVQDNAFYGVVVNSNGNKFSNDNFFDNPVDLYCSGPSGYKSSNNFSSTKCSINEFCDFAVCSTENLPSNISAVLLSKQVTQCGSIENPGSYTLENDLNLSIYENISSALGKGLSCITISSPNVELDCNGHAIVHSGYGVSVPAASPGTYNVSINNCAFINDTTAVAASGALQLDLNNDTARGGTFGLYLNAVTTGVINNTKLQGNQYGVYLNGSSGVAFVNTTASRNQYGVFVANGTSNIYQQSTFTNNSKQDIYCSAGTYSSQGNIFQNNKCGSTDCQWASSCATMTLPPISTYPLTSCGSITTPGNYSLGANLNSQKNCIIVRVSNVTLSCSGKKIVGINVGSAISGSGVSNVTVTGCTVDSFNDGVNFTGGKYITIKGLRTNNTNTSIALSGSTYDNVQNDTALYSADTGFVFSSVSNSVVTNDIAQYSFDGSDGFTFSSSHNDVIQFDNAYGNEGYGFSFVSSKMNIVANNSATSNLKADYYCSSDTSGFFAETGGVNNGVNKVGCTWLVAVPPGNLQQSCAAISSSNLVSLSYDMVYPYGETCFNVYDSGNSTGNSTVINCNGHTVFATDGGTFVDVGNATGVKIENCYLKGFTSPIVASGDSAQVINNTISNSNVSIALLNGKLSEVERNMIFNASYGIFLDNAQYATIKQNTMINTNISISAFGGAGTTMTDNNATGGSVGIYLVNSDDNELQDNILRNTSTAGMVCASGSQNSTSLNRDQGGNVCTNNVGCNWMTASPDCAPAKT